MVIHISELNIWLQGKTIKEFKPIPSVSRHMFMGCAVLCEKTAYKDLLLVKAKERNVLFNDALTTFYLQ